MPGVLLFLSFLAIVLFIIVIKFGDPLAESLSQNTFWSSFGSIGLLVACILIFLTVVGFLLVFHHDTESVWFLIKILISTIVVALAINYFFSILLLVCDSISFICVCLVRRSSLASAYFFFDSDSVS